MPGGANCNNAHPSRNVGWSTSSGTTGRAQKNAKTRQCARTYFDAQSRDAAQRRLACAAVSPPKHIKKAVPTEQFDELLRQHKRLAAQECMVRELLIRAVIKLGEAVPGSPDGPEGWRLTLPAIGDDAGSYKLRVQGMDYNAPSELVVEREPRAEGGSNDKVNTDG